MKKQKGFTLIELLVVIAILGLLTTIALVSLNSARAKARDSRRLADIKQIQTALEMYYSASSTYPANLTDATFLSDYMKNVPTDPQGSNVSDCTGATEAYTYTQTESGQSYTLNYCLKAAAAGAPNSVVGINTATPAGIAD